MSRRIIDRPDWAPPAPGDAGARDAARLRSVAVRQRSVHNVLRGMFFACVAVTSVCTFTGPWALGAACVIVGLVLGVIVGPLHEEWANALDRRADVATKATEHLLVHELLAMRWNLVRTEFEKLPPLGNERLEFTDAVHAAWALVENAAADYGKTLSSTIDADRTLHRLHRSLCAATEQLEAETAAGPVDAADALLEEFAR